MEESTAVQEQGKQETIPQRQELVSEVVPMLKGVPYDLIQHFSISPIDFIPHTQQRLREIYRLLEGSNFIEKFKSLKKVERKIGSSGSELVRYEKVWNWLRLNYAARQHPHGEKARLRREALETSRRQPK